MQESVDNDAGVVIRDTRHGRLICVREDLDFDEVLSSLEQELLQGESSLEGAQVSLDLGWRELSESDFERLLQPLAPVQLVGVLSTSLQTRTVAEGRGFKAIIGRLGLSQHHGRRMRRKSKEDSSEAVESVPILSPESPAPDAPPEPSTSVSSLPSPSAPKASEETEREQEGILYIKRTLRSGQKACYPGHIVIWGDLNPGSEVEAEGDILVLGNVRGRLYAGCSGNVSAQIYCQALHPTVIRIADGLWTGETKDLSMKLPSTVRISCLKDQLYFEVAPVAR